MDPGLRRDDERERRFYQGLIRLFLILRVFRVSSFCFFHFHFAPPAGASERFHQPPPSAWNSAPESARRFVCAWVRLSFACCQACSAVSTVRKSDADRAHHPRALPAHQKTQARAPVVIVLDDENAHSTPRDDARGAECYRRRYAARQVVMPRPGHCDRVGRPRFSGITM